MSNGANHHNKSKLYSLSVACGTGSLDIVKMLVNLGANVECEGEGKKDKKLQCITTCMLTHFILEWLHRIPLS